MAMISAVEFCIEREYDRLVRAVTGACGSFALAEDAVQEGFARAWERQQHGESFENLAGWVATAALNYARTGWRRRKAERGALLRAAARPCAEDADRWSALTEVVRAAVEGLPRRQREAVYLYYFLDFDVNTVADLLDVAPGTVKTALSRARTHLATELCDYRTES